MARGGGGRGRRNPRNGFRGKPKKSKTNSSKKRKNSTNNDDDMRRKYAKVFNEPRNKPKVQEPGSARDETHVEESEEEVLDPVLELLSTFDRSPQFHNITDSSSEEESSEKYNDRHKLIADNDSDDMEDTDDDEPVVEDNDISEELVGSEERSEDDDASEEEAEGAANEEEADDDASEEEAEDDDASEEEAEDDAASEEEAEDDDASEEGAASEKEAKGEEAEDDDASEEEAASEEAAEDDDASEEGAEGVASEEAAEDDGSEEEGDEDEEGDDPFAQHFNQMLPESVVEQLSKKENWDTIEESWPKLGQISKSSLRSDLQCIPQPIDYTRIALSTGLHDLKVKSQLLAGWKKVSAHEEAENPFTDLQQELFSVMNSYSDLLFCRRTSENCKELRAAYCLHIMNHVLKTRSQIIRHNSNLKQKEDVPEEYRDQGLTRPKVLILVPFRESAMHIVSTLIDIHSPDDSSNVTNKIRFNDEFGFTESDRHKKKLAVALPPDHAVTFAGNIDDDFRVGIAVIKKSLRLYSSFYSSDVIIASPLGLRTVVGAEGERGRDFDFLSSIEIVIVDQAEILLMQNWEHLTHILDHFHLRPKESHDVDFSRVRLWNLEGWSKQYRQTMCFSGVVCPEVHSLFSRRCCNYAGIVKTVGPLGNGSIRQVVAQLPQVFQKFQSVSPYEDADARFRYFVDRVLPQFKEGMMSRTMIFVPSYFDFVRLRNHFRKVDLSFVQICEYTPRSKVAQARDRFIHEERRYLLYTERTHFYRRYRIKGIRHLVFYQLPLLPHLYSDLCNLTQLQGLGDLKGDSSYLTCTVMFSKYDAHRLAAVVGTNRASHMLSSEKDVFMFLTGEA